MSLDDEWMNFQNTTNTNSVIDNMPQKKVIQNQMSDIPKCSDIYISTQTKIAYLNSKINLYKTINWFKKKSFNLF